MSKEINKQAIIKDLEDKISKANHEYENIHDEQNKQLSVSDRVYDAWIDTLSSYDPQNKLLLKVGSEPVSNWQKHIHSHPMLSLDKAKTNEDYLNWHNKYIKEADEVLVTLKLDGLSVILEYENGKLIRGCTRGGGDSGEDITQNIVKMKCVPHRLPKRINAIVRGEILLNKECFEKQFTDYSNPRNAASGVCRRYDGENCENLSILCYELDCEDIKSNSFKEMFDNLKELNFTCPPYYILNTKPDKSISQQVIELKDLYFAKLRDEYEFLLDGMVIHQNDLAKWYACGYNEHHPYSSIAFKFEAPCKETSVKNIIDQVGNIGHITPVCIFTEPVKLAGAMVEKASLHNYRNITDLGIDIGAKIIVSRRNDVIPYIEEVTESTNSIYQAPQNCPVCGTKTIMTGEFLICPNSSNCPAQVVGRIINWVNTINILEWGEALITRLVKSNKVIVISDLYTLKKEDLLTIERMGDKSAEKALNILHSKKEMPIEKFFGGLSIPMAGESIFGKISKAGYDTVSKIRNITLNELMDISGLGPAKAKSVYEGLKTNYNLIDDLLSVGIVVKERSGSLKGKTFVFTGSMVNERKILMQTVIDNGGIVGKSVSKTTDYLVAADHTTSKAQAAQKHGTKCITENEFLAMVK